MKRATPILILLAALTICTQDATASAPLPRTFSVQPTACPDGGSPACTYPGTATVYVERDQDAFVLKHELGHLFDYQRLNDGDGVWNQGTGLEGLLSPAERFADAYATCALGWRPDRGEWENSYGYQPTLKRHRQICGAINRVGDRG